MANEKIVNRENLKAFRQANDERYKSGQVVVGQTKTIKAVSDESGTTQETPFILQGTGTANNTDIVDTSPIGKHVEKQGNTVCVNQLVQNPNFDGTTNWTNNNPTLQSISALNNKLTITSTDGYFGRVKTSVVVPNGHKVLMIGSITSSVALPDAFTLRTSGNVYIGGEAGTTLTANQKRTIYQIIDATSEGAIIEIGCNSIGTQYGSAGSTIVVENVYCVDLTQWFNGDIPQDILDNPSHWSWYQNYGDYIAYNTGSLETADGQYLECGGRNVWDEETELGTYNTTTGEKANDNSKLRSINAVRVIPNTTYRTYSGSSSADGQYLNILFYDANDNFISFGGGVRNSTFTTPANCFYIRFYLNSAYGTTYNHDITISLYYTTGDGYDQYFPYEEPKVYDTGTEVLRSAGSVKDTKAPDGTITRRIGYVDLGTLEWLWNASSGGMWYSNQLSSLAKIGQGENDAPNIVCDKFETLSNFVFVNTPHPNGITIYRDNGNLLVRNGSSTIQPTGTLYYELATPTTEQGTPFSENIEINDYGTMGWLDTNNAYVDIPQGCKIFYPADYVLFLDSLNTITQGDASKLVLDSDLSASETQRDSIDTQLKNAVGGTLRQCLCVKESLDFDNTAFVDLGTLSWTYYVTSPSHFSASLSGVKIGTAKILCTKYKAVASGGGSSLTVDKTINIHNSSAYVQIKDDTYTDATAFKNAMKGVLLAYEKASS